MGPDSHLERLHPKQKLLDIWVYLALLLTTIAVYSETRGFGFVDYDDPSYVANNHTSPGMTLNGAIWAFTTSEEANWFPLTRLSHMLDCQLFGMRSGWHHFTSVLIHAITALLLLAFLQRATGARWPSAFVALMFAIHPLHVESVAWIAERKDVLCGLFWMLTLWTYLRYVEHSTLRRYLAALLSFGLGLMAKPMIVSLPFVLLLLDFWPLRRLQPASWTTTSRPRPNGPVRWAHAVWEKLPFFALSSGASVVAYIAQRNSGAVELNGVHPMGLRFGNAIVSYMMYGDKMFWPTRLAVLYPFPSTLSAWRIVLACVIVVSISVLVVRRLISCPYLAVGWLWYLGSLVPVIGLVQIGMQSRADRYMYLPMIGLLIMVAWSGLDISMRWPWTRTVLMSLVAGAIASCMWITRSQLNYWKDSETLYRRAIEVTEDNFVMHDNLGCILVKRPGHLAEAVAEHRAAVEISPNFVPAHVNLGVALAKLPGRLPQAIDEWKVALTLNPGSAEAHMNIGAALAESPTRGEEAVSHLRTAIRLKPEYPEAHMNLGVALSRIPGRVLEAISEYEEAVRLKPNYAEAHTNLGLALAQVPDRLTDSINELQMAVALDPSSDAAHYNLAFILSGIRGREADAMAEYEAVLRISPDHASAHNNLGTLLARTPGRLPEAVSEFEAAVRADPSYADAHRNLGFALSKTPGRLAEAIAELGTAMSLRPDPSVLELLDRLRMVQANEH